ncbi:hypothetical protein ACFL3V_07015 [Nanoarchaeota archaeon]
MEPTIDRTVTGYAGPNQRVDYMKLNGVDRVVQFSIDSMSATYITAVSMKGSNMRLDPDGLDCIMADAGLIPGGNDLDMHEANSEFGIEYGFNDPKRMTIEELRRADAIGESMVWIGFAPEEEGSASRIQLEIYPELVDKFSRPSMRRFVEGVLDMVVRYAEHPSSYTK